MCNELPDLLMSHKIICIKVKDICNVYFLVNKILKTLHTIHHVNRKKFQLISLASPAGNTLLLLMSLLKVCGLFARLKVTA